MSEKVTKRITIDGVDKTGKDLLLQYVVRLSTHKYVIQARGIMSQLAYSDIYDRDYEYDLSIYQNDIVFYLKGDIKDLEVRHKITKEPKIDIQRDIDAFDKAAELLRKNNVTVIELDTSYHTPYQNALTIIEYMENYK